MNIEKCLDIARTIGYLFRNAILEKYIGEIAYRELSLYYGWQLRNELEKDIARIIKKYADKVAHYKEEELERRK